MKKDIFSDNDLFARVNDKIVEIQLIQSEVLKNTMSFFGERGFLPINPPIIHEYIPNKEDELYFSVDDSIFALNSSNALYLSAYAIMLGKVFAISPTFRLETSCRHLTEFRMLEVELVNCTFDECIVLVRDYIKFLLEVLCRMPKRTRFANRFKQLYSSFQIDFQSYSDIIKKLKKSGCHIEYGADLSDYDDQVSDIIKNPTFVIDYPFPVASWTAQPKEQNIALAFNLILPNQYGELAEGCQRTSDPKILAYKFEKAGIRSLDWYIQAVAESNSARSGFGLGIERLIRWLIGSQNIADTVLFPRFMEKRKR